MAKVGVTVISRRRRPWWSDRHVPYHSVVIVFRSAFCSHLRPSDHLLIVVLS